MAKKCEATVYDEAGKDIGQCLVDSLYIVMFRGASEKESISLCRCHLGDYLTPGQINYVQPLEKT